MFSDVEISLLAHTHSILTKLEEETGVNPGDNAIKLFSPK
jgi:hypothetical protein